MLTRSLSLRIAPWLVVCASLLMGCEAGREAEQTKQLLESLDRQIEAAPGMARIEGLKARLFDEADNEQLLSDLGDALFESQRFQEAIEIFERAKGINPMNSDVLNDLGLSYFYVGQADRALAAVDGALDADAGNKYAWLSKGFMLVKLGREAEAVGPLGKVKELDPGGELAAEAERLLAQLGSTQ